MLAFSFRFYLMPYICALSQCFYLRFLHMSFNRHAQYHLAIYKAFQCFHRACILYPPPPSYVPIPQASQIYGFQDIVNLKTTPNIVSQFVHLFIVITVQKWDKAIGYRWRGLVVRVSDSCARDPGSIPGRATSRPTQAFNPSNSEQQINWHLAMRQ